MEETRRLPYLRTGDVFISSASMGRTIFARIRAAISSSPHTENPFDELKSRGRIEDEKFMKIIVEKLPIMAGDLLNLSMEIEKEQGITFTMTNLESRLKQMVDKGYVELQETPFGNQYKKI